MRPVRAVAATTHSWSPRIPAHSAPPLQGRAAEPLGDESLRYARLSLLQHEVEVEAEDMDKNGTVLGEEEGGGQRRAGNW